MKFISPNNFFKANTNITRIYKKFRRINTPNGDLYISGKYNLIDEYIVRELSAKRFPTHIRGNFALIWISEGYNVFAVDHHCTIPLFYTDNHVTSVYSLLLNTLQDKTINERIKIQKMLLGGLSIGEETTYEEIKRVEPGHYVINGSKYRFIDLLTTEENRNIDIGYFKSMFIGHIKEHMDKKNGLLLSGGKDSTNVASVLKKYNLHNKFNFLTLTSHNQVFTERDIVKRIADELNIEINYLELQSTGKGLLTPELDDHFYSLWYENTHPAKHYAITSNNLQDHVFFTGEVGLSEYGIPGYILHAVQHKEFTPRDLAIFMINDYHTNCVFGNFKSEHKLNNIKKKSPLHKEVVEYVIDYYETLTKDSTLSFLNTINLVKSVTWSTSRNWGPSQDPYVDFFHIFNLWDIVHYMHTLPGEYRFIKNKFEKAFYQTAWGNDMCKIPWEYPKNGLGIPAHDKY